MKNIARRAIMSAVAAAIALTTLPAFAQQQDDESESRPDIVVFLADDLSYDDTAPWGNEDARTPNIAALAASGLSFDRAFVASPSCAPSRAAMLTGMMPARNLAEANHQRPDPAVRKLPSYLQSLGYQVVAFGKVAHYQQTGPYGFDHYAHDSFHDDKAIPAAIEWLKARKDNRPLALFVGSNWPHAPWPASTDGYRPDAIGLPPRSVDTPESRKARARYYAAVSRLDQELGDTLAAVDTVLGSDTFVLFSSDHGSQWPFRKWDLYDAGTRVPMIVRWKGHVVEGSRTGAMVSWIDILPTLVEIGGGEVRAGIDGRSFAGLFQPNSRFAGRDAIFTTHNNDGSVNVYPSRAIRTDRWKYIRNLRPDLVHTTHIDQRQRDRDAYFLSWRRAAETDAEAKRIVDAYYQRPAEELYDLAADPYEQRNLADNAEYAPVLRDLRSRLAAWRADQGDNRPVKGRPHHSREVVGRAAD